MSEAYRIASINFANSQSLKLQSSNSQAGSVPAKDASIDLTSIVISTKKSVLTIQSRKATGAINGERVIL